MSVAALVVAAALSRIGDPYAWGATGPNAFDCSGLVQWSYQQAGIGVPRTSQQQAAGGQHVARDQLAPGDIIVYYPDASHVGLYVGHGDVVHASTYGVPVAEVPIDAAGPYRGARRYIQEIPVTDTLFADVSYFQAPVNDSYPYPVLSIRSNDGTFEDPNFARNYQWCVNACVAGKLEFFIVYFYWRPGNGDVDTHIASVERLGGPHPRMVTMIDVESGGNPGGDHSSELNAEYARLVAWLGGNDKRVIAYANLGDEKALWQFKPASLDWILAGYGANPNDPSVVKLAHQYTDGTGFSPGLPQGCPPFGNCDMNSADGLDPEAFAAACGLADTPTGGPFMALTDQQQADLYNAFMGTAAVVADIQTQLRGPNLSGWPQLGQNAQGEDLTEVDALAAIRTDIAKLQAAVDALKAAKS